MNTTAFSPTVRLVRQALALGLALFTLYTAAFGVFPDMIQRGVHLALVLVLIFLLPLAHAATPRPRAKTVVDLAAAGAALILIGYHVVFFDQVAARWGELTTLEFWFGIGSVVVVLEATRRMIGWPIVILALVFLGYAFLGPYLPGLLQHRGYSVERVVSQLYLGGGGLFGTPLGVSATFVTLIVIFGALLEQSGAGQVLMDVATSLTGRARGGPAKAAVVGSSLMGMISGTAVANVLTTGTVSIPLMKRNGYRPHVAGAIEAVASTGGQLMPPVMGAAAFLMADMTEIPYTEIALAAVLPAALYYIVLFTVVHLEAVKTAIPILATADLPALRATLLQGGHLLLSIVVFVYLLFDGYSVMYSAFFAIVSAYLASFLRRFSRLGPRRLLAALVSGVEAVLPVAIACAAAGIIIGVITLTGLGLRFSSLIVSVSGGNSFIALVLTMLASLLLGMGLPTAAAYILVATLVAPALVEMGIDLLAAHLFVFYAAMLSSITPPVALAAYAAAGLANANPMQIALTAVKYGCAAFIVPFFFAYHPVLIGKGSAWAVALTGLSSVLGALCIAAALQGWCLLRCHWLERFGLAAGGLLILAPGYATDALGVIPIVAVALTQFYRRRRAGGAPLLPGYRPAGNHPEERR